MGNLLRVWLFPAPNAAAPPATYMLGSCVDPVTAIDVLPGGKLLLAAHGKSRRVRVLFFPNLKEFSSFELPPESLCTPKFTAPLRATVLDAEFHRITERALRTGVVLRVVLNVAMRDEPPTAAHFAVRARMVAYGSSVYDSMVLHFTDMLGRYNTMRGMPPAYSRIDALALSHDGCFVLLLRGCALYTRRFDGAPLDGPSTVTELQLLASADELTPPLHMVDTRDALLVYSAARRTLFAFDRVSCACVRRTPVPLALCFMLAARAAPTAALCANDRGDVFVLDCASVLHVFA